MDSKGKMTEPCIKDNVAVQLTISELKKEDMLQYTDKIKNFTFLSACIMIILLFASSKEADKFIDVYEVRVH